MASLVESYEEEDEDDELLLLAPLEPLAVVCDEHRSTSSVRPMAVKDAESWVTAALTKRRRPAPARPAVIGLAAASAAADAADAPAPEVEEV
jgi:hypothetical protein